MYNWFMWGRRCLSWTSTWSRRSVILGQTHTGRWFWFWLSVECSDLGSSRWSRRWSYFWLFRPVTKWSVWFPVQRCTWKSNIVGTISFALNLCMNKYIIQLIYQHKYAQAIILFHVVLLLDLGRRLLCPHWSWKSGLINSWLIIVVLVIQIQSAIYLYNFVIIHNISLFIIIYSPFALGLTLINTYINIW